MSEFVLLLLLIIARVILGGGHGLTRIGVATFACMMFFWIFAGEILLYRNLSKCEEVTVTEFVNESYEQRKSRKAPSYNAKANGDTVHFPYKALTIQDGGKEYRSILGGYWRRFREDDEPHERHAFRIMGVDVWKFPRDPNRSGRLEVKAMALPPGRYAWMRPGPRLGYMHRDPETGKPVDISFTTIAVMSFMYYVVFGLLWAGSLALLVRWYVRRRRERRVAVASVDPS